MATLLIVDVPHKGVAVFVHVTMTSADRRIVFSMRFEFSGANGSIETDETNSSATNVSFKSSERCILRLIMVTRGIQY